MHEESSIEKFQLHEDDFRNWFDKLSSRVCRCGESVYAVAHDEETKLLRVYGLKVGSVSVGDDGELRFQTGDADNVQYVVVCGGCGKVTGYNAQVVLQLILGGEADDDA